MYKIYRTEAIILESRPHGEANKIFTVYTEEFGLLDGHAQGVRKITSKLRAHLGEFSHIRLSLVRGREKWRIVGAEKIRGGEELFSRQDHFGLLSNIFRLLKRLCAGEESNRPLFDHLVQGFEFLSGNSLDADAVRNFECLMVLKILHFLGYIREDEKIGVLISSPLSFELIAEAGKIRSSLIGEINNSIRASQL
jgi:DNA repair protein RecO (recombination protein O)